MTTLTAPPQALPPYGVWHAELSVKTPGGFYETTRCACVGRDASQAVAEALTVARNSFRDTPGAEALDVLEVWFVRSVG